MRPSVFLLLSVVGAAEFIFPDWSLTGDDLWAYNPDEYNPDIFSQEEYYSDGDIQTQSDLYEEPFLVVNDNLPLDLDIHITDETGWVDYPTSDLFADSSDDCYGSSDEEFLLFGKNRLRPRQGQTCSARRNKKKKTTTNENDENLGFPGLDEISAKVTVNEFSEQQCPSASYPNAGVPVCSSGNRDDEGQSLIFENALILTNCKRITPSNLQHCPPKQRFCCVSFVATGQSENLQMIVDLTSEQGTGFQCYRVISFEDTQ